jgi:glyoxylase-like metal-dependent hydrolase (beta-lactamase superfamily II)
MIKTKTFYFNDLRECTYVLWDESGEAVIVDPGCYTDNEKSRLEKFITENNLKPVKILQTHGHFDHVLGSAFATERWGIDTYIHSDDVHLFENASNYTGMFGYNVDAVSSRLVILSDGDIVSFGNSKLKVIHTPGHTRGGVCFYNEEDGNRFVLTGDTLFAGSIGRTDLPGGDYDMLMESLLSKLTVIGREYRVMPGHGPETSIGEELDTNPFLRYE